jgi:hypothetical protein
MIAAPWLENENFLKTSKQEPKAVLAFDEHGNCLAGIQSSSIFSERKVRSQRTVVIAEIARPKVPGDVARRQISFGEKKKEIPRVIELKQRSRKLVVGFKLVDFDSVDDDILMLIVIHLIHQHSHERVAFHKGL